MSDARGGVRSVLRPMTCAAVVAAMVAVMAGCSGSPGPAASRASPPAPAASASGSLGDAPNSSAGNRPTVTPLPIDPTWKVLPGDGVWTPAGPTVGGSPAMYTTVVHNAATAGPVGLAWLDTSRLRVSLYAGTTEPTGSWPNQGAVPPALRPGLVAAFNSGFKLDESRGGWYEAGRSAVPLVTGAASLVIFADGSATVGAWGRDVSLTPSVVAVRQNLALLVDGGQPAPTVASDIFVTWGASLNHMASTWRSGIGVDFRGDLVYAAGPSLDPAGLAAALIAAGAERAMELDINPEWVSFDTFAPDHPGAASSGLTGTKLLPSMYFSTVHFFTPFGRDFFAVFTRG